MAGFAHFLDVAGLANGEMINAKLSYFVYPFRKKLKRDIITATPKFYLFDVVVANYLARRSVEALEGDKAGKSFEHFI